MNTQWFYDSSVQRFHGLSTDTKPTNCTNGSVFVELDTAKIYLFNEAALTWHAIPDDSTGDYNDLSNKPSINGVTLSGDKSLSDIGIVNPMVIKGRVDTVADLANVQNPQPGWVYFVGTSGAAELEEYVYIENGNSGSWQFLGYNTIVIDTEMSATSENPVQNKVITNALSGKVNTVDGKGLSTEDYTTAEKNKLAGLSNYDDTEVRGLIATKADASILTPISESAYEALVTKDKPLYFIYD